MSEQDWSKAALFDNPVVREQVQERIKIERPAEVERAVSPPVPVQVQPELRAVLDDPQTSEQLWQQVSEPRPTPIDDRIAAAEVGAALYLLHSIHFQGKPGTEHLVRELDRRLLGDEDDDGEPPYLDA